MRFSVIVPLYNKAPYVEKALQSILSQTFTDYELIVVDDGSTDGSAEVATPLIPSEKGRMIRQTNAGVSAARNHGVAASQGDYLCFLDADDWWDPTFLEEMDRMINAYPDAGIWGSNYWYVKSGRQRICVIGVQTGYFDYCRVYAERLQMPLWTGAVCMPRVLLDELGGFKPHLQLGEDFDMWIRVALNHKVAFLNKPLSYYNQDVDVSQRGIGRLKDPAHHMLWNLDYLSDEEKTNPDYKRLIDNLRVYSLEPYFLSNKYHAAAVEQLAKVDWSLQPAGKYRYYRRPLWLLRAENRFMRVGSAIKQRLIKKHIL